MKVVRQTGRRAAAVCSRPEARPHLVFVQPHVCQPQGVVRHSVLALGGPIRPPFPENVSNSRARDDEQLTSTHPDLVGSRTHVNSAHSAEGQHMAFMRLTSTKQVSYQNEGKVHILKLSVFMIKKKPNPKNNVAFFYSPVSKTVFSDMVF